MNTITVSFPGRAFSTGRDRRGEPLLYNEEIKTKLDELVSTLKPGDDILIEKVYKDGTHQDAHLLVVNDMSVIKSGDLPMFYTIHQSPVLEGWHLAADLGQYRSKTQVVTVTVQST